MNLREIVNMKGIVNMKKTFVLLLGLLMSGSVRGDQTEKNPLGVLPEAAPASNKSSNRWEKDIEAFEKADVENPPPKSGIEFVGSSTIRKWTTLAEDFPGKPVFNRGFGGAEIADAIRYASRIIIPYAPKMIFFHSGGNDLANGKTAEQVFVDFKEFIAIIHAKLPETEVFYLSLKPTVKREKVRSEQQKVNQSIQDFVKTNPLVHYIDNYNLVADAEGNPRPELFDKDNLHLNAEGYKLLAERVRPFLENTAAK
jgi:lysophospholipase L1-like esterase